MQKTFLLITFFVILNSCSWAEAQQILYPQEYISTDEQRQASTGVKYIIDFYTRMGFRKEIQNVTFRVFSDFESFKQYQKSNSKTLKSDSGYFLRRKHEIVVLRKERFIKVFFHEFSHFYLDEQFEQIPRWIDEGLAEYLENLQIDSFNNVLHKKQKLKIARLRAWSRQEIDQSFDWIISASSKEWSANNSNPEAKSSTLSYCLVDFIMSNQNGAKIIGSILSQLKANKTSNEAIELAYPGGKYQLRHDFVAYYSN